MKTFWDRVAHFYDLNEFVFNGSVYEQMINEVYDRVPEGANVLDAAAGTGLVAANIAPKAKNVVCLDLSKKMLKQINVKAHKLGLDNIFFKTGDICSIPFKDETFDCVVAANVLHLVNDPRAAFGELMRVLKKGGILMLPTFLSAENDSTAIKLYKLIGFRPEREFGFMTYCDMIKYFGYEAEIGYIDGKIPCGFAVIRKERE